MNVLSREKQIEVVAALILPDATRGATAHQQRPHIRGSKGPDQREDENPSHDRNAPGKPAKSTRVVSVAAIVHDNAHDVTSDNATYLSYTHP